MGDEDLQSLVDELSERLQRSVAIDDVGLRLLAASRHFGDEDAVRVASVLNRGVRPEIADRVLGQGIAGWTRPGRVRIDVPGCRPRWCVPIRCDGLLLGYLWLIDDASAATEAQLASAEAAAGRAGIVLYRRLLLHERVKARHEAILRELVGSDPAGRLQAAADLRAEQVFAAEAGPFRVVAAQCVDEPGAAAGAHEVALEAAVEEGLRALPEQGRLMVAQRSRAWILLGPPATAAAELPDVLGGRIIARFTDLTRGAGRVVVGVGAPVDRLDRVPDSYRQALLAVRAALLVPGLGDLARSGELGPYELLLRLPAAELRAAARVPALVALERADAHGVLLSTLAAFLDHAGDVRRTAALLCVHRATLYHRLRRIEALTGCRLDRGDDRLTLHLGLKLRDLAGPERPDATPPG
ncbi:PucR family transcriptional regulator [Embleya sp. NPDC059259]|uniref:PucR family transcriptional regulator n=1 Tax=unclassified Embleya TaxID=2699296 RepID=UPI0036855D04